MKEIVRGDVIYADLGQHPKSSVQSGLRTCIVISNNKNNLSSAVLNVCPFTGRLDKKYIPVHVTVSPEDVKGYFETVSVCMPEQIVTIDKRKVISKTGHIDENSEIMRQINDAVLMQLGIEIKGDESMYDKVESGNRLRQLREEAGKTQQEVAKEVGLSVDTICKLEQGKRCPSITVVEVLRNYYNTTADYIISGYQETVEPGGALLESVPEQKRAVVEQIMKNIEELIK